MAAPGSEGLAGSLHRAPEHRASSSQLGMKASVAAVLGAEGLGGLSISAMGGRVASGELGGLAGTGPRLPSRSSSQASLKPRLAPLLG